MRIATIPAPSIEGEDILCALLPGWGEQGAERGGKLHMAGTWERGLSLSRCRTKEGACCFSFQPVFMARGAKRNWSKREIGKAAEQQEMSQMLVPSPGKGAVLPTSRTLSWLNIEREVGIYKRQRREENQNKVGQKRKLYHLQELLVLYHGASQPHLRTNEIFYIIL